MFRPKGTTFVFLLLGLLVIAPFVSAQEAGQAEREAMYYRYLEFASYVKGGSIQPHWLADGSSFWYAEGAPANTVIWKVDPAANTKTELFDTARLRKALAPLLGHEPPYQGLPFEKFTFVGDPNDTGGTPVPPEAAATHKEQAVKFTVEGKEFILQLDTYKITRAPALSEEERSRLVPQRREVLSPDRRWFARIMDHNLWLRSTTDGRSVQMTTDGIEDYQWGWGTWWVYAPQPWSPDSFKLALKKVDVRKVPKIPIVHWLKQTVEVDWVPYAMISGGPIRQYELFIVDIL
ncbi:MAG: DPP IV N-terminal domain-containing protein, partial [Terriglobia bacterium]